MDPSESDVLAANERFYAAFANRDAEAMEALWASDHAITCIHPGWMPLETREEVLSSWRAILSNPAQARVVAGGATVTVAGEMAVVLCREFVGGSPLVATNVFVLEDGAWRLVHHHSGGVVVMG